MVNDKNSSLYYIDFSFDEQRLAARPLPRRWQVAATCPRENPEYICRLHQRRAELIRRMGWPDTTSRPADSSPPCSR